MQVILDSLFAHPGSAPTGDGKKGEFRDWTGRSQDTLDKAIIRSRFLSRDGWRCAPSSTITHRNRGRII